MKCFDVNEKNVKMGIPVVNEPYPHVVLGEGGHKRATWVAIGKRDATAMIQPRRVPCPGRGQTESHFGEELPAEKQTSLACEKCGKTHTGWTDQPGWNGGKNWTRRHPNEGEIDGPPCVSNAGVVVLKSDKGDKPPKFLIVAPRPGDDRAIVLWRVASGYRGSASISAGDERVMVIASDSAWHSGRGNMGETAETLAILKPGQELRAKISGRRVQETRARLRWDGKNITVDFGGEELFAATSDEVEGEYI